MTFYSLPVFLGAIFSLAAGIFIYTANKQSQRNISFSLFCLSLFVWLFGYSVAYSIKDQSLALLFCRIACTGAMFTAPAFYHFSVSFVEKWDEIKYVVVSYLIMFIIAPFSMTSDLFLSGVYKYYWGFYSKAGLLHPVYLILFFALFLKGFYLLLRERQKKDINPIQRVQINYVFLAYVVALLGAIDYAPKYGVEIFPFGFIFEILFVIIVAYAIRWHRLLDIELVIKKTLVFAGLFASAYTIFVGFAFLGSLMFENIVQSRWIAMVPSVFMIVLIFRPLESFLRNITDRYLYQKRYDYRSLLRTFTNDVLTVLELGKLVNLTVNKLVQIMKLDRVLIMLYDKANEELRIVASSGAHVPEYTLRGNEELDAYMRKVGGYTLWRDSERKDTLRMDIEKNMDKLNTILVIPLVHRGDMIGVLSLGEKKSDEVYTQDDIDMLRSLARTLSVAITNAQLFKELSEAQEQATQREKMAVIGTLSAGINHEICNPLGIARGQCEMFLLNVAEGLYKDRSDKELLEKAQEIMRKVINETDRATTITRKLSSFAKPAKGEPKEEVSIEEELDKVIALVERDLELENISIIKDISPELPYISADPKQLQEIFFNIIRNAAQSIKGNGKVTIRASSINSIVTIDIEDTGEGISKSHLNQIFNPFFTTKDPGKGTGLGLFIVKQIVERNKGRITVQSELGKGTTFRLIFNAVSNEATTYGGAGYPPKVGRDEHKL